MFSAMVVISSPRSKSLLGEEDDDALNKTQSATCKSEAEGVDTCGTVNKSSTNVAVKEENNNNEEAEQEDNAGEEGDEKAQDTGEEEEGRGMKLKEEFGDEAEEEAVYGSGKEGGALKTCSYGTGEEFQGVDTCSYKSGTVTAEVGSAVKLEERADTMTAYEYSEGEEEEPRSYYVDVAMNKKAKVDMRPRVARRMSYYVCKEMDNDYAFYKDHGHTGVQKMIANGQMLDD